MLTPKVNCYPKNSESITYFPYPPLLPTHPPAQHILVPNNGIESMACTTVDMIKYRLDPYSSISVKFWSVYHIGNFNCNIVLAKCCMLSMDLQKLKLSTSDANQVDVWRPVVYPHYVANTILELATLQAYTTNMSALKFIVSLSPKSTIYHATDPIPT